VTFAEGLNILPTLLYPKSRGSVALRSSDARVHPAIDPNYLADPDDVEVLAGGVLLAEKLAFAQPFDR
jgi:choline dehydrogenase